ncbi:hypothetical protein [Streptacidiphilus pinicola]|uniref:hypothetical protein n=1 Tax=Streptacidiphilus pinicola TaxID=2219663 RepID=UPI000E30A11B|nr:hypothetical protein [Streptacidiphilus pinicola]
MSQAADPFPAEALHACQVLARMLQRVPRPESVQLFTADHWSSPWLQVHLYPDPDDAQLAAYQRALGGRLTRSRREDDVRSVVYSELATVVDRVRVQVWNVNEAPHPAAEQPATDASDPEVSDGVPDGVPEGATDEAPAAQALETADAP